MTNTPIVITNAFVSLGGTDISDHVMSVTLKYMAESQDTTAMGDGTRKKIGGLKDWTVELEAYNDYAASELDSILFAAVGTTSVLIIKPVNTTISTSNPAFTGTALLESYSPIAGSVGELAKTPVSFSASGTLDRDVTP